MVILGRGSRIRNLIFHICFMNEMRYRDSISRQEQPFLRFIGNSLVRGPVWVPLINNRGDQLCSATMKPPGVLDYPCFHSKMHFVCALAEY